MRYLALPWGIGGIFLLLGYALWRLTPKAIDAFSFEWTTWLWVLFIANVGFMAYSEGYKGFQLNFSPRVAARSRYLFHHGNWWQLLTAPAFCMAFFSAPKRRVIATWILTLSIVLLVIIFQQLSQPLKGILDAGVVVGLTWGIVSMLISVFRVWTGKESPDPEVRSSSVNTETTSETMT